MVILKVVNVSRSERPPLDTKMAEVSAIAGVAETTTSATSAGDGRCCDGC